MIEREAGTERVADMRTAVALLNSLEIVNLSEEDARHGK